MADSEGAVLAPLDLSAFAKHDSPDVKSGFLTQLEIEALVGQCQEGEWLFVTAASLPLHIHLRASLFFAVTSVTSLLARLSQQTPDLVGNLLRQLAASASQNVGAATLFMSLVGVAAQSAVLSLRDHGVERVIPLSNFNFALVAKPAGGKTPVFDFAIRRPFGLWSLASKESVDKAIENVPNPDGHLSKKDTPPALSKLVMNHGGSSRWGSRRCVNVNEFRIMFFQRVQLV